MASSVPGVLTALAAVWEPVAPTYIGEPINQQPPNRVYVVVAWTGPDSPAVVMQQASVDAGNQLTMERYDVVCQVVCWGGAPDLQRLITAVYGVHDTLRASLSADPTIGDACMFASIRETSLNLDQTQQGAFAALQVAVAVQAQRL